MEEGSLRNVVTLVLAKEERDSGTAGSYQTRDETAVDPTLNLTAKRANCFHRALGTGMNRKICVVI